MGKIARLLITSVAVLAIFLVASIAVSASTLDMANVETPIKVTKFKDQIQIAIMQEADVYKITKDGVLVYEGTQNSYQDILVEDFHRYKIGLFNINGEMIDNFSVKVNNIHKIKGDLKLNERNTTIDEYNKIKNAIDGGDIDYISGTNVTYLSWTDIPSDSGIYEVYRDGVKVGETTDKFFRDNTEPGNRYVYEIKTLYTAMDINKQVFEGSLSVILDSPLNNEDSFNSVQQLFEGLGDNEASAIPNGDILNIEYKTFIPFVAVSPPFSSRWFKGNNRGFSSSSSNYKTRTNVVANFNTGKLSSSAQASTSEECSNSACSRIIASAPASASGIRITHDSQSTTKMAWRVNHSASLPLFENSPMINYYYEADLTKTSLKVTGSHDQAPSHEMYIKYGTQAVTVHRFELTSPNDFWKLINAFYPQKVFKVTL